MHFQALGLHLKRTANTVECCVCSHRNICITWVGGSVFYLCVCGIYLPSLLSFEIVLCFSTVNIKTVVIDTHAFACRFILFFFTFLSSHDV